VSIDTLAGEFDRLRDNAVGLATDLELQRQQAVTSQADCAVQLNAAREQVTTLQATLAAAVSRVKELEGGGGGFATWTPGTLLAAGGTYLLPWGQPVRIDVRVPNVTLVGGWVWPEPNGPMASVTANVGGDGLSVVGTRFSWDDGPAGTAKLPLKPCFRTYARNAGLSRCTFGRVTTAVEAMTPCDGLAMAYCDGSADVRGGYVYCGGGRGVSLYRCTALDSANENLVRCSPQNGVIPDGFSVDACDLQQLGAKAVIELRSVKNATVRNSILRAAVGHAALSCGRENPADGPGASNVRFYDCVCYNGRLEIDPVSTDVSFENLQLYGLRYGTVNTAEARKLYDVGVTVNGTFGGMKNVRLRNVVGIIGGETVKPFLAYTAKELIAGLDDDGSSGWRVQPQP
jgi:hypothetical protein